MKKLILITLGLLLFTASIAAAQQTVEGVLRFYSDNIATEDGVSNVDASGGACTVYLFYTMTNGGLTGDIQSLECNLTISGTFGFNALQDNEATPNYIVPAMSFADGVAKAIDYTFPTTPTLAGLGSDSYYLGKLLVMTTTPCEIRVGPMTGTTTFADDAGNGLYESPGIVTSVEGAVYAGNSVGGDPTNAMADWSGVTFTLNGGGSVENDSATWSDVKTLFR